MRNTRKMDHLAGPTLRRAVAQRMMRETILERDGKVVTLSDGQKVTEFINCSYLGLDTHPRLVQGAREAVEEWGVHFCCARSRFTIEWNSRLEVELSELYSAPSITFPSVTAAHLSALPLAASGLLLGEERRVRVLYDRLAHASMQYLKPVLAEEAEVVTLAHNDMEALEQACKEAQKENVALLYVADGVYSMGGVSPLDDLARLSSKYGLYVYLDDAHGTSILGGQGEGYALATLGELPERFFLTFSMAKGFGCNGGGLVLPSKEQAELVRSYGMSYAFSAPLDFSVVGAALESLKLHRNGTVADRQRQLWQRVRTIKGGDEKLTTPIVMAQVGDADRAVEHGLSLRNKGYFVSVCFFPTVARGQAQLRIAVTAEHSDEDIEGLIQALKEEGLSWI